MDTPCTQADIDRIRFAAEGYAKYLERIAKRLDGIESRSEDDSEALLEAASELRQLASK